jgi:hypothetical protein
MEFSLKAQSDFSRAPAHGRGSLFTGLGAAPFIAAWLTWVSARPLGPAEAQNARSPEVALFI